SATQPLGSTQPLDRARLSSRLGEVNEGFGKIAEGATQLRDGLSEGVAKLQAALWLAKKTGLPPTPTPPAPGDPKAAREASSTGLTQAASAIFAPARPGLLPRIESLPGDMAAASSSSKSADPKPAAAPAPKADPAKAADPNEVMVAQLHEAAEGA